MYAKHPEMRPFGSPRPEESYNPLRDAMVQTIKAPSYGNYLVALESLGMMWTAVLHPSSDQASKIASKMWGECTYMPLAALRPIDTGRMRQDRTGNWVPVFIDPLN